MRSAFFGEGGWKPCRTTGFTNLSIMCRAAVLIRFHTDLGVTSGPGADEGEERASALTTSSGIDSGLLLKGRSMDDWVMAGPPGKK